MIKKTAYGGIVCSICLSLLSLFQVAVLQKDIGKMQKDNESQKIVAGSIRWYGNDWRVLNNEGHTPINIERIETLSQTEFIIYYTFQADKVVSLICATDETFAEYGVFVGASVGGEKAYVRLELPEEYDDGIYQSSNIWVYGIFEVSQ